MRVLAVSKSLCGYVSNQVQYNMESDIIYPFLFYCIHTTYKIHSIHFLRYIPFSYYHYYYNTNPPYILYQHIYDTI